MILTHVCGRLSDAAYARKTVDPLQLDYADAQKHLLRRTTRGGRPRPRWPAAWAS